MKPYCFNAISRCFILGAIVFLISGFFHESAIPDVNTTGTEFANTGIVSLEKYRHKDAAGGRSCASLLDALSVPSKIDIYLDREAKCDPPEHGHRRDFKQIVQAMTANSAFVYTRKQGERVLTRIYVLSGNNKNKQNDLPALDNTQGVSNPGRIDPEGTGYVQAMSGGSATDKRDKKTDRDSSGYIPGEILVKFRSDVGREKIRRILKELDYTGKKHLSGLDYYKVQLPDNLSVQEARKILSSKKEVEVAEPNYIMHTQYEPSDERLDEQWALQKTNATAAWDRQKGSRDVTIAVVDTGVDYEHEDLQGNIWKNTDESLDGSDNDTNGYDDDTMGWDFVDNDNDPKDVDGHGTFVSGIAGAVGDNDQGMAGIALNCTIMPLRCGTDRDNDGESELPSDNVAEGIEYAYKNGADVINLSLGKHEKSEFVKEAIDQATANGAVVVAAAGNSGEKQKFYPAAYDNDALISVGSTNEEDEKSGFSNYGDWVDVSAPGTSVLTTEVDNRYKDESGTSMSTPHVAGESALIISEYPELDNTEVKKLILQSADVLDSLEEYNNISGRIDIGKGLQGLDKSPVIYSVEPGEVHQGEGLQINGANFGSRSTTSSVILEGEQLQIEDWNNTRILCQIPVDAESGSLYVETRNGTSNKINLQVLPRFYTESDIGLSPSREQEEDKAWTGDDAQFLFELPFSFPFYGREFNSVVVSTNGYLHLVDESMTYQSSRQFLKENTAIAPFWEDLVMNATSGDGMYLTENSSKVVFGWNGTKYEDSDSELNFEAVLHEDGRIDFRYHQIEVSKDIDPVIGISGGEKAGFNFSRYSGNSSLTGLATRFSRIDSPAWDRDFAPAPATIYGGVEIGEDQLDAGGDYTLTLSNKNGTNRITSDENGLNAQGYYVLSVPLFDPGKNPDGIELNSTLKLHLYENDSELTVLEPEDGLLQLKKLQKIDIRAKDMDSGSGGGGSGGGGCDFAVGSGSGFVRELLLLLVFCGLARLFLCTRKQKGRTRTC